jgi:hypothetical protein
VARKSKASRIRGAALDDDCRDFLLACVEEFQPCPGVAEGQDVLRRNPASCEARVRVSNGFEM